MKDYIYTIFIIFIRLYQTIYFYIVVIETPQKLFFSVIIVFIIHFSVYTFDSILINNLPNQQAKAKQILGPGMRLHTYSKHLLPGITSIPSNNVNLKTQIEA